ncbi:MAG: isoprenyl transferase [Syntrophaceticus sp.]|nr:isoprenyl transferase [Syntrophaceticus sp.]MDD3313896.1 isoprenyl transferase [Syntrophaceticus sp.]MDD4358974.1 isoprenyl transferase [Syntrophaceticus sp.]MDD4782200.1 isoprenyl transferase [Syntrophaceticus sp.]
MKNTSKDNVSENKRNDTRKNIKLNRVPYHVAIIMDGNGRWAQEKGFSRSEGHRAGMESLRSSVEFCLDLGIRILSVFAFSTENWKRPQEEINTLMGLLYEYIQKELDQLHKEQVQIRAIGRLGELQPLAQYEINRAHKLTANNKKLILNIALNYGGRTEIVDATRRIAQLAVDGQIDPQQISEESIQKYLYTSDLPDPDLLIRPAGELRISNYLLWQIAYTEFYHTSVYWPDFDKEEFLKALLSYQCRERRFGGL